MALRTVVVVGAATGPTGNYERVHVFLGFTGLTGQIEQCLQATGPTGAHGHLQRVYKSGGPTAGVRNIIIAGHAGPTGS